MFEQTVDAEEAVRAISKGLVVPSKEPGFRETWRLVKEWSQYFMTGWSADDKGRPDLRFAEGKVAMIWAGTWDFARIQNDPNRKFDDGFFYIPPITSETSSMVKDPPLQPVGLGGLGPGWIINQASQKRGNVEAIIDWIQYCMTPANNELFVNEQPQFVPAVKGTKARPELQPFLDSLKRQGPNGGFQIAPTSFFGELWSDVERNNTLFLLGQMSEDDLFKRLDEIALKNADVQVKKFDKAKNPQTGAWDLTKW